jgi:hypothetical protein
MLKKGRLPALLIAGVAIVFVCLYAGGVIRLPRRAVSGDTVVLRDRYFIANCNDIYLNPDSYEGKKIQLEGIYTEKISGTGAVHRFVIRYGPGCCANDGVAGFAFDPQAEYDWGGFAENDWVKVEGVLQKSGGSVYIAPSAVALGERGLETVND